MSVCLVMLRFRPVQELSRTSLHDLFDALTAAYGAVFGPGNCPQESEAASLLTTAAVNNEEGVCVLPSFLQRPSQVCTTTQSYAKLMS
jgi:hypothetical protein